METAGLAGYTSYAASKGGVIAITNSLAAERLMAATHVVQTYAEIEKLLLE